MESRTQNLPFVEAWVQSPTPARPISHESMRETDPNVNVNADKVRGRL